MQTATTLLDDILAVARRRPTAVALRETGGRHILYAQLAAGVERASAGLRRAGLRDGDRVLFAVRPGIDSVSLILAIIHAGGVVVFADPRMGRDVFRQRVALARPRWVVAETLAYVAGSRTAAGRIARRWCGDMGSIDEVQARHVRVGPLFPGVPKALSVRVLTRARDGTDPIARTAGAELAIIFTSGTTASPKAVVHTNSSLGAGLGLVGAHLEIGSADVVHTTEMHLILPALQAGATTMVPRHRRMLPSRYMRELTDNMVTTVFASPASMDLVSRWSMDSGVRMPPHLRTILLGSAPAYIPVLQRLRRAIAPTTSVWVVYAMTEMLPVCRIEMEEKIGAGSAVGDLVGRPFPGVRVSVADDGEIMLGGPNLFRGYLDGPMVSEHATGDVGMIDSAGRLVLRGRSKDMIIRDDTNIYPALVEGCVTAIEGVRRCRLVGVPDDIRGDEHVILVVEPEAGMDAIALHRRVRRDIDDGPHALPIDVRPDRIMVAAIPDHPVSGKIDTDALRARLR